MEQGNDETRGRGSEAGRGEPGSECGRDWERVREHRRRRRHRHGHRKERILHTRISEQLAEDIRDAAEELRVPVSNLVRNVLEEAFSAAERVGGDVGDLLSEVLEEAERANERFRRARRRRRAFRARVREETWERRGEPEQPAEAEAAEEPAAPAATSGPAPVAEGAGPEPAGAEATQRPDPLADVIAWQPVVLNTRRFCARTGRLLEAGQSAYLAIGPHGPTGHYVHEDALDLD